MKVRVLSVLFVVVLFVPAAASVAQDPFVAETFDDPTLPGWEVDNVVVIDGVLRVEPDGLAFHPLPVDDFALHIRVRRSGQGDALIHYRAGETGNYAVRLGEGFVAVQRDHGAVDEIARAPATSASGGWVSLTVVVRGPDHTIMIDDQPVIELSDPQSFEGGGVVLRVEDDAPVEFDDLVVEAFDLSPTPTTDTTTANTDGFSWIRTGGPIGGLGYDVRMHPDNPDLLYVTDAFAGVFISRDGGDTWVPSNNGITTRIGPSGDGIPVFCLTIDPNDPDTVWVGTQGTRGIFKSVDGGQTWVEKDEGVIEFDGISFRGFSVDPTDSDVVYAAAEISSWAWFGEPRMGREFDLTAGVVYKTIDGGENWSPIWRGENLARYVWIDSRDSRVLYISTGIFDREAANSDPATGTPGGEGVLKSVDGGATWSQVNDGLGNLYVGTLFMHPEDPDVLLAGSANNQYREGVGTYLSTDGGSTWTQTLAEETHSVEISTSDPSIAYAANTGAIHRSSDGGRTWVRVSGAEPIWGPPGIVAGFPIDLQVDPRDPDRLFANAYGGGNFLSEDGGATWAVASSGYTGAQVRALAADPEAPGRVVAAVRSGLFLTPDGGTTWTGLLSDPVRALEWNAIAIDPDDSQHLIAGTNWDGIIAESSDGGTTWSRLDPRFGEGKGLRVITFAPSDPSTVYAGTGAFRTASTFDGNLPAAGVYVSHDGGTQWEPVGGTEIAAAHVADLAVQSDDPRVVYAATTRDGLLMTSDGGRTWTELSTGVAASVGALSVAVDPSDPKHLLAGFAPGGVRSSSDGGDSWEVATGFFPESEITAIVFDPTDSTIAYASDVFSGVYQSTDSGRSWSSINSGLRTRAVNALAVASDGRHLYAATDGEGVFRLDLDGSPPPIAQTAAPSPGTADAEISTTTTTATTQAGSATTFAAAEADVDDSRGMNIPFVAAAVLLLIVMVGGVALWHRRSS